MTPTQLLVRALLQGAARYEWSVQGFGMLRMYLSREVRLHIWHSAFRVPNVSTIHDHPWDFHSEVVCGQIENITYLRSPKRWHGLASLNEPVAIPATHMMARIRCGVGGGIVEEGKEEWLEVSKHHVLKPGQWYEEWGSQLHETGYEDGTVTIVSRKFRSDTEHARVCFPVGTEWVSAEPRPATPAEVELGASAALSRLGELS